MKKFLIPIITTIIIAIAGVLIFNYNKKVKVTFMFEDEIIKVIKTNGNEKLSFPEIKTDGKLIGWYLDLEDRSSKNKVSDKTYIEKRIGEDTIIYAYVEYQINFLFDNETIETGDNPTSFSYQSGQIVLKTPSKEGYNFLGWYKDETSEERITTINLESKKNYNLYPRWEIKNNTMSFNTQGGSDVESIVADYKQNVKAPKTPTRDHYTFLYWSSTSIGEEEYIFSKMPSDNKVIYAIWDPINYSINYDLDDGTNNVLNKSIYNHTNLPLVLKDPVKEGYSFKGWYLDDQFDEEIITINTITSNSINLYAKWEINQYTISFDSKGTNNIASIKDYYNSTVTIPLNLEKDEFIFLGWSLEENGNQIYQSNKMPAKDITLYAVWESIKYDINYFNLFDSDNSNNQLKYINQEEEITLKAPTRVGYDFLGWYSSNESNEKITKIKSNSSGNINLYAKWQIRKYSISFDVNGGSEIIEFDPFDYNALIPTPLIPTQLGYEFEAWFTILENDMIGARFIFNEETKMPAHDLKLIAKWTPLKYIISYELNGGENDPANFTSYNTDPKGGFMLEKPNKYGYEFKGWFLDTDLDNEIISIDFGKARPYNVIAKWEIGQFEISFDYDVEPIVGDFNINITSPIPTRDYYLFSHWEDENGEEFVFDTMPGINIKLYPKWTPIDYEITYQLFGAINNPNPSSFNYETLFPLVLEDPTKEGHTFKGWYMDSNYENKLNQIDYFISSVKELFAKWEENKYYLTFEYQNGEDSTSNLVVYNEIINAPNTPEKIGYSFSHWSLNQSKIEYVFNTMPGYDLTLYAVWTPQTYNITYDFNGGEGKYDGVDGLVLKYTIENTPFYFSPDQNNLNVQKEGHRFVGWFSDAGLLNQKNGVNKNEVGTIKVYAKWEVLEYEIVFITPEDATKINSIFVTYDYLLDLVTFPGEEEVTKPGAIFKLWSTKTSIETTIANGAKMEAKKLLLYAKWIDIEYDINYENVDDATNNNPITIIYKESITLSDPIKEGYRFGGWYLDETYESIITFIPEGTLNEITLYAKWDKEYNITYIYLDESNVSLEDVNNINPNVVITSETINLVSATIEGYKFIGWYLNSVKILELSEINSEIEVTGKFAKINNIIYVFEDDGAINSVNNYDQISVGETLELEDPFLSGYRFMGWFSNSEYQGANIIEVIYNEEDSEGLTLYAKFEVMPFSITFELDGGQNSELNENNKEFNIYGSLKEGKNIKLKDPIKEGYEFLGWYIDNEFSEAIEEVVVGTIGDLSVYAKWQIRKYSISFNVNGGSLVNSITLNFGETIQEISNPTKPGYEFSYWYDGIEDSETSYNIGTMPSRNITLFAKWEAIDYNITYIIEGSYENISNENETSFNADNELILKPLILEDELFVGWSLEDKIISVIKNIYKNIELVAIITQKKEIVYHFNGGNINELNPTKFTPGETIYLLDPDKEGYIFMGWYDNQTQGNKIISIETLDHDLDLYARWVNKYDNHNGLGYQIVDYYNNEKQTLEVGDYILMGHYPQSVKQINVDIIEPINANGYYTGSDGNLYEKFVANPYVARVNPYKFTNNMIVETNEIYYFKLEPIRWEILEINSNGDLVLLSEVVLINKRFNEMYHGVINSKYANEFDSSELNEWLNSEFKVNSFIMNQRNLIEEITILSKEELFIDYEYTNKNRKASDFALANGIEIDKNLFPYYWSKTRSSGETKNHQVFIVKENKEMDNTVSNIQYGVLPCLIIKINS